MKLGIETNKTNLDCNFKTLPIKPVKVKIYNKKAYLSTDFFLNRLKTLEESIQLVTFIKDRCYFIGFFLSINDILFSHLYQFNF